MLKVRYEIATLKMTGWCAFEKNWDSLEAREGEAITWLANYDGVAPMETDFYYLNAAKDTIVANPDYTPPKPPRDLAAEFDDLKVKLKEKGVIE